MARIDLDHIAHAYRPNPTKPSDYALKEVHHTWDDGGAYALLGPSGCGKTTLLNVISGLLVPSSGRILFGGRDVTRLPTEARNIAQVFQFPVIYDTMTVYDNLAFPLRNRRVPAPDVDRAVRETADMIGLTPKLARKARGLTADEKQKISLGRGLVRQDVNAILFDEPLTVIDPHMKWVLRTQLKQLHKRFGFTMIYVTHDQTEALTFADKVVVMYEGEVVQIGTPAELFERPRHTFVGYFIGSPGMNVIPAEVRGNEARIAGHAIRLPASYRPSDGRTEVGVRPEFITLADRPSGTNGGATGIPVDVRAVEDVGRYRIVRAKLGSSDLNVVLKEGVPVPASPTAIFDLDHINVYVDSHLVEPESRA